MGTAEVWVMFGGGGNCHIQQGRKRGLATRPTCLSPSVCEPGITGSHNPCVPSSACPFSVSWPCHKTAEQRDHWCCYCFVMGFYYSNLG